MAITKSTPKEEMLRNGQKCSKCGNCCTHGSGFLIKEDVPRIAKFLGLTEADLKQHCLQELEIFHTRMLKPLTIKNKKPYGTCIFFNRDEGCKIHAVKPFQCRLSNCGKEGEQILKWFFINYCVNPDDPQSVREWASYLKHYEALPGGSLQDIVKDAKKLAKILNYEIMR